MAEAEETLKRIESHTSVVGTIVLNSEGNAIRKSFDTGTSCRYARPLRNFTAMARSAIRDLDPENDLTFLRIRTKKQEIMVGPENNCLLLVIQNLKSE